MEAFGPIFGGRVEQWMPSDASPTLGLGEHKCATCAQNAEFFSLSCSAAPRPDDSDDDNDGNHEDRRIGCSVRLETFRGIRDVLNMSMCPTISLDGIYL